MLNSKIFILFALIATISTAPAFAELDSILIKGLDTKVNYHLQYTSDGMTVDSVVADLDFISLIFDVSVTEAIGAMSITLDRHVFDAKIGSEDDEFFILADGEEVQFTEEKNDISRTLSFIIPQGSEEVEIIGTILFGNSFLLAMEQADAQAEAAAQEEDRLAQLMDACGEGTVFEDGACVLEVIEKESVNPTPLLYGIFSAMGIGLAVTLILWGIVKRSHKKLDAESDAS